MTHQLLKEIASNSSKLHKIAVIKREAEAGNKDFFAGLHFALNSLDTFGVKKVSVRTGPDGPGLSFVTFATFAYEFIARNITGGKQQDTIADLMAMATNHEWNGWYRLILIKDLKAGFSESTVNKAVKGVNKDYVIPTTPYMRCSLPEKSNMEDWDFAEGVYSQIKADGKFTYVNISKAGDIWITSRSGTLVPAGAMGIEEDALKTFTHGTSTHGELTVYRNGVMLERQIGNGILNSVAQGGSFGEGEIAVFDCWDQIPLDQFVPKGEYKVPYHTRFKALEKQVMARALDGSNDVLQIHIIETKIVYSADELLEHYRDARRRKLEGTVAKSRYCFWKDGTSKDQVKQKEVIDIELEVTGFTAGKNKFAHLFGSLECTSSDRLLQVYASGMSDDLRNAIHNDRAGWMSGIVTIRSNGIMYSTKVGKPHSLFLPRLIERRDDKDTADSFADIEAQFAAAIVPETEEVDSD
jgi:DNA ligase-1